MAEMKWFKPAGNRPNAKGKGGGKSGGKGGGKKPWHLDHRKGTYHVDGDFDEDEEDHPAAEEEDEATGGAGDDDEDENEGESDDLESDYEDEGVEGEEGPDALMEVYYQGLKAKKKLTGKGFKRTKPGDKTPAKNKKNSVCKDCKGKGHWSGDPECPKVKDGSVPLFQPKPKKNFTGVVSSGTVTGRPVAQVFTPQRPGRIGDMRVINDSYLTNTETPGLKTTIDLAIYTVAQLRRWLERKNLNSDGDNEQLIAKVRKAMDDWSERRRVEAEGWTFAGVTTVDVRGAYVNGEVVAPPYVTEPGASRTSTTRTSERSCEHRRVENGGDATTMWRNSRDCRVRLSTVDRKSGKSAHFIGCVDCAPKARRLWGRTFDVDDMDSIPDIENCDTLPYAINFAETDQKVIPDSECRRSVAGKRWHDRMSSTLARKGFTPVKREIEENFKFGDGRVERSTTAWVYVPCGVAWISRMHRRGQGRFGVPPAVERGSNGAPRRGVGLPTEDDLRDGRGREGPGHGPDGLGTPGHSRHGLR